MDRYPPGTPSIPSQILGQDVLPQDTQNSPDGTISKIMKDNDTYTMIIRTGVMFFFIQI